MDCVGWVELGGRCWGGMCEGWVMRWVWCGFTVGEKETKMMGNLREGMGWVGGWVWEMCDGGSVRALRKASHLD